MSIRFLADEDLKSAIIEGLCAVEPTIDILDAKTSGLRGKKDPALLELAAQQDRIVLSHDKNTMPGHFQGRLRDGKSHPGLVIIPQQSSNRCSHSIDTALLGILRYIRVAGQDCVFARQSSVWIKFLGFPHEFLAVYAGKA